MLSFNETLISVCSCHRQQTHQVERWERRRIISGNATGVEERRQRSARTFHFIAFKVPLISVARPRRFRDSLVKARTCMESLVGPSSELGAIHHRIDPKRVRKQPQISEIRADGVWWLISLPHRRDTLSGNFLLPGCVRPIRLPFLPLS